MFLAVDLISAPGQLSQNDFTDFEVMIISDKLVSYSSLPEVFKKSSKNSFNFYLLSDYPDSTLYRQIQMLCLSFGITIIPPRLTVDQTVSYILKIIHPGREIHSSNVVSLFGTQPGTGVTSITLAIAKALAKLSKIKVGVLGLNVLNPGDYFFGGYNGLYLDELKSYLNNKMFSEEQLNSNMHSIDGFKYLAGNRDLKKRLHYTIEEINYLIELAKNLFDIILVDSGALYDNALTIQSMLCSDLRLLIGTQNLSGLRSWQLAHEQIIESLGYSNDSFLLICNKFKDNINLPNVKNLQGLYSLSVLQVIPDLGDLGLFAEQEKSLLTTYKNKAYDSSIEKIVNSLTKLYGITIEPENTPTRAKGVLSKLFPNSSWAVSR